MGGCCCCDGTNRNINQLMRKANNEESITIKLLLLGPGSTGKSTLFKSLQILHSGPILDDEKNITKSLIRHNMINGINLLITNSSGLYTKDNNKYSNCLLQFDKMTDDEKIVFENASDIITQYLNDSVLTVDQNYIDDENLDDIRDAIKVFWNLNEIKNTMINHGKNFAFSDNLEYFFDNVDDIMHPNYVPTDQDCLRNRTKTTGMNQYLYGGPNDIHPNSRNGTKFNIIDVGGQRAERRKWVNYFDNVHGLLFVASLIDYNKVLYEDNSQNGMVEAVELFDDITGLDCFQRCEIILILNKDDLLLKKLIRTPDNGLIECFSREANWPHFVYDDEDGDNNNNNKNKNKNRNKKNNNDDLDAKDDIDSSRTVIIDGSEYWDTSYETEYINCCRNENISDIEREQALNILHENVKSFILELFHKRNNTRSKRLFHHYTIATVHSIVDTVFNDIQNMLIRKNLGAAGLIYSNPPQTSSSNRNGMNNNNNNNIKNNYMLDRIDANINPRGNQELINQSMVRVPSEHSEQTMSIENYHPTAI